MTNQRRNWSREETIVALNMFCTIPFNECSARHPEIRKVAELLGRSPAALNMKVGNFGRLDATLASRGITGLTNGSKLDELIWEEFYGDFSALALQSEQILASLGVEDSSLKLPAGEEITRQVKQRVNQDFFRRMVLSSYNNKCCITGISNPRLVEACHISDWSGDEKNRTNPHNGLTMTPTLHRAYDAMLIAVSPDLIVHVSNRILEDNCMSTSANTFFKEINGQHITMPDRFAPSKELLDYHYQKYLRECV